MSFLEQQFPADISFGATGGPEFSTSVVTLQNGFEQRNINWSIARAKYNVSQGIKTQAQLDALIAFFRNAGGKAQGFRFKDWSDYQGIGQSIGTGNGSTTQFQLVKHYTSGSATVARIITKPVAGSVTIFVNGVLQTSGVSVNMATGVITFTSAPANLAAISADFEFDVPVRFDTDHLAATLENKNERAWQNIPLVEVRK